MRLYTQEDYGSNFESHARSLQFNPEKAFDNSGAVRDLHYARVEDAKTLGRAAARQAQLDNLYMQGAQSVENAYFNANNKALQGLLALSSTALNTYKQLQDIKVARQKEDAVLDSVAWGEDVPQVAQEEATIKQQSELAQTVEAKENANVAKDLQNSPDINSKSVAHVLQETTSYNLLKGVNSNLHSARAIHGVYLAEALRNLPADKMPQTAAEAQVFLREINRQFFRDTGIVKGQVDRSQVAEILAPTMAMNTQNTLVNLVQTAIKTAQTSNLEEAKGYISTIVDGAKPTDAGKIWKEASERMAYGNVGYTGISGASNQAALEEILQNAAQNGDTALINALRIVEQVPGQKGTELQKKYDHIFDKYEKAARQGAIADYQLRKSEEQMQVKQSIDFFYREPTPENRQKAIGILRGIGSEEALQEASRLAEYGLGYDPQKKFELLEMEQKGIPIPEDTLKGLLNSGAISPQEFKRFSRNSNGESEADKKVTTTLKAMDSSIKAALQNGATAGSGAPGDVIASVGIRHEALKEDLKASVLAEVRVNPNLASDPKLLSQTIQDKLSYLLKQPQYTLEKKPQSGWTWKAELKSDRNLSSITIGPGVQDFSKLKPEEVFGKLRIPKSELDATKDRFISLDTLRADVKRVLNGDKPSNTTRLFSKNLGLSSTAFIDSQLRVNGMPGLDILRRGPEYQQQVLNLSSPRGMRDGFKALQTMGFPRKGAAYLSGNIQQESGWNGRRTWGEVAGDGSDRNGGLVSWMDDVQRNHFRLRNIERYLGKPIQQATHAEQLQAMVWEMKRRNTWAYKTFMNPNASDRDLRAASYQYWGYGHEGARFKYAQSLLQSD